MLADLPAAEGEQQEKEQVKVVGGEDAKGAADEKVIGGLAQRQFFVFIAKEDGGDQIAAEDEKKADEGTHFHGEGKLQLAEPAGVVVEEDPEYCEEAEAVQLGSIGYTRGGLIGDRNGHGIKVAGCGFPEK